MTRFWLSLTVLAALTTSAAGAAAPDLAEKLRTSRKALENSPFERPLLLESTELDGQVHGSVLALVEHPIGDLRESLDTPAEWCDVLILHLNVKSCAAGRSGAGESLALLLGRKGAEEGDGSHAIDFQLKVAESREQRFSVEMRAASGPLGTTDYRLSLEAIPVGDRSSFLRFTYAYTYGTAARLAMSTYLGTVGRDKVGFSTTAPTGAGEPVYVGGLRGVLERNTMRYYLAIETYLASAAQPAIGRSGWRLRTWFDATERYPRQLHELSKTDYLAGKQSHLSQRVSEPRVFSEAAPG